MSYLHLQPLPSGRFSFDTSISHGQKKLRKSDQAAQRAYEKIIDEFDPEWCPDISPGQRPSAKRMPLQGCGCTPTNALQGACGEGCDDGGCNEDSYCGECDACKDGE